MGRDLRDAFANLGGGYYGCGEDIVFRSEVREQCFVGADEAVGLGGRICFGALGQVGRVASVGDVFAFAFRGRGERGGCFCGRHVCCFLLARGMR